MLSIFSLNISAYADILVFMKAAAKLFKALADETRLRILALLSHGELCVCDLMEVLQLPQSTVSRHLAHLRNAGLVHDRRQGVWIYYRLAEATTAVNNTSELGDIVLSLPQALRQLESGSVDHAMLRAYLATKKQSACT